VNQLTSDTTLRNLYARTGNFLLLYEGTGTPCTGHWPEYAREQMTWILAARFVRHRFTGGCVNRIAQTRRQNQITARKNDGTASVPSVASGRMGAVKGG
jgi:hypothetical protein